MTESTAEPVSPEVCDICGAAPVNDDDGLHCPAEGDDLHNLVYWLERLPTFDANACAMRQAGRVVVQTLADQRAEIACLKTARPQWIPIWERLPEVGDDIIATFITGDVYPVVVDRDSDGDLFFKMYTSDIHTALFTTNHLTHWMSMPEAAQP